MKLPNVKLIGINLMVIPKKAEEKTAGGLYVPEEAKIQPNEGVVIACGPDCKTVQMGNYIHYVKSRGTKMMYGEQELIIIQENENDILCIDDEKVVNWD